MPLSCLDSEDSQKHEKYAAATKEIRKNVLHIVIICLPTFHFPPGLWQPGGLGGDNTTSFVPNGIGSFNKSHLPGS